MSITVEIRGEYIQLDQLLKTTGLCHSGGYAHAEIEAGNVLVDGAVETRKRAKLRPASTSPRATWSPTLTMGRWLMLVFWLERVYLVIL